MIVVRTPLRISLFGGGSDLPAYCDKYTGHVVSGAINHYVYAAVCDRFDGRIRVSGNQLAVVDKPEEIADDRIREALLLAGEKSIDISIMSSMPTAGCGLGGSSAMLVSVVHAIAALRNKQCSDVVEYASTAAHIEIDRCGLPIGFQDHYAAACGGISRMVFTSGYPRVTVHQFWTQSQIGPKLRDHLLLFYTGLERNSMDILARQSANTKQSPLTAMELHVMVQLARQAEESIISGDIHNIGRLLHASWLLKRDLVAGITNDQIDEWYEIAIDAGAHGGKCCGAGGGGFLLFFAPPENHARIKEALPLRYVPFDWDYEGTKVVCCQ